MQYRPSSGLAFKIVEMRKVNISTLINIKGYKLPNRNDREQLCIAFLKAYGLPYFYPGTFGKYDSVYENQLVCYQYRKDFDAWLDSDDALEVYREIKGIAYDDANIAKILRKRELRTLRLLRQQIS